MNREHSDSYWLGYLLMAAKIVCTHTTATATALSFLCDAVKAIEADLAREKEASNGR